MNTAQYVEQMHKGAPVLVNHKQFDALALAFGATKDPALYYRDVYSFADGSRIAWNHDATPGHEAEIMQ